MKRELNPQSIPCTLALYLQRKAPYHAPWFSNAVHTLTPHISKTHQLANIISFFVLMAGQITGCEVGWQLDLPAGALASQN